MDISYYDRFSKIYDLFSPKWYYHKARYHAIQQLDLKEGQTILNMPCGTGQNLEYFQQYLNDSGRIIGIDLSEGMLKKAKNKVENNNWQNVELHEADATNINAPWLSKNIEQPVRVDAVLCDLGLSGFPQWQGIIDNMLDILKPNGIIVIMDWYIPIPSLTSSIVKWIGKGEVDRPLYQYLESRVTDFELHDSFNRGGVFVAKGIKKYPNEK